MCGRYALAASSHDLAEEFGVGVPSFTFEGSYNIAPGRDVPVLARDRKGTRLGLLRWGLLPPWARDDGPGFANARAETVAAKPSFRDAFARRRCLVPADGFYEWRDRVPHWIHPEEPGRWTFAGIWSSWRDGSKDAVHAMAILTTESIGQLRGMVGHRQRCRSAGGGTACASPRAFRDPSGVGRGEPDVE
jgi:putative SOS response-associated peptidase YedK